MDSTRFHRKLWNIWAGGLHIRNVHNNLFSLIRLLELFELERQEDATFGEPICDRFNHS